MYSVTRFLKSILISLCTGIASTGVSAKMVEMADNELSDVSGQAFINLTTDQNSGIDYTRLNLGLKVETQLNIKQLELGKYARAGEPIDSADILINNFALGTVNADDTVNPFLITDPYLELAYDGNKVVGVRVGFDEAKGHLSGDIKSLTGNIPIKIEGTASPIFDAASTFEDVLLTLAGVTRSTRLQADAGLVTQDGSSDLTRATYSGLENGQRLTCSDCNLTGFTDALLSLFSSNGCEVLSLPTCFPLSNFQSLPVGNLNVVDNPNTAAIEGAARGFFLSLQTQDVAWRDKDSNAFRNVLAGAFLNIPNYRDENGNIVAPIKLDFEQAFNGIARQDTCLGSATVGC
ncbi:DUF6160 family protein [Pseudomonas sp. RL_15y_Pfl2_60]|uniref:DUF6160 family protein n=1 Tax=Pseudomonas sp. RL_15y_Pfl2_60 TaxID=3088709 RepID=UPI0030DD2F52